MLTAKLYKRTSRKDCVDGEVGVCLFQRDSEVRMSRGPLLVSSGMRMGEGHSLEQLLGKPQRGCGGDYFGGKIIVFIFSGLDLEGCSSPEQMEPFKVALTPPPRRPWTAMGEGAGIRFYKDENSSLREPKMRGFNKKDSPLSCTITARHFYGNQVKVCVFGGVALRVWWGG